MCVTHRNGAPPGNQSGLCRGPGVPAAGRLWLQLIPLGFAALRPHPPAASGTSFLVAFILSWESARSSQVPLSRSFPQRQLSHENISFSTLQINPEETTVPAKPRGPQSRGLGVGVRCLRAGCSAPSSSGESGPRLWPVACCAQQRERKVAASGAKLNLFPVH